MRNINQISLAVLLTLFLCTSTSANVPEPSVSLPTLPQQYLETRYQQMQESFEKRTTFFLKGRHYEPWRPNKSKIEILKEFDQINEWRFHAWYIDPGAKTLVSKIDFMLAQDLLEKGYYRRPQFIAFQYNQTDGTYNSSTILLNGFKFLALEAPTAKTLRNFLLLLQNHRVSQLIRIDSNNEDTRSNSYPYWNGKLRVDPKTKETMLNISQGYNAIPYAMRYYVLKEWTDNQGIEPNRLLKLIQAVRKSYDPNGLVACHSEYGTGRVGTFIAGFLLLNEIDRQIAAGASKNNLTISIEKIVMQLSLQRAYLIRKPEQYIALYRLVDLYIASLK